ncbi:MAG TPA: AIR synthase-related protein [Bacteriovoracaceae bacterium]|nr:AIR synthase-related protein [Bacteriovoracaceae bacterium]
MARTMFTILSKGASSHQVFWLDCQGEAPSTCELSKLKDKIIDEIDQELLIGAGEEFISRFKQVRFPVELVSFRPRVTDNPAKCFLQLLQGDPLFSGRHIEVHSGLIKNQTTLDFNPLIQLKTLFRAQGELHDIFHLDFSTDREQGPTVQEIQLLDLEEKELTALSAQQCWALSAQEMTAIKEHFRSAPVQQQRRDDGLPPSPTDVELELIALTWSEHCKHKIFSARIDYKDAGQEFVVEGLFKEFIKTPTYDLDKDWAISLFDDNAGVVRFREGIDLCIKVETHNSPSALDPYGGALTGILGVNRDILGTGLGARPVANTNVFCVGLPHEKDLPENLLPPEEILRGIHRGVMDGGNKSGIPTVNGAIYFDESFSGKPLVYCGTVGVLPAEINGKSAVVKGQRPGDLIVMIGGGVGIDGIHGATASSLVMDASTSSGMVQIGDPFLQRRMMDFLLVARDRLLYNSLTDNGAGGLASSVGEMASLTSGARLNLESVPLKYHGLLPWQILVSESQERMTLSVPVENWAELKLLAEFYQVEASSIGSFTADGFLTCLYSEKIVCRLDLNFLHHGLPRMELKARYSPREYLSWRPQPRRTTEPHDHQEILKGLLSHPVLASKEKWVRQYDHEVQGATVVKPFDGLERTAPNDAGVLWYGAHGVEGYDGFAVASGLCPHFSIDDTYLMAKLAVDEAVRNLICHGADPAKIALVDNFCWPDPLPSEKNQDAEYKLAQLVRACMGLKEMVTLYQMPLVSGKDSMKNDYHGEDIRISVLPTLLVTALGHIPDVRTVPHSHAKPGDLLYRIGLKDYQEYFGHFLHGLLPILRDNRREFDWPHIRCLYQKIFTASTSGLITSLHDISEGGFMPALFETLLLENGGIDLKLNSSDDVHAYLYSELPGHFIASVSPDRRGPFEQAFDKRELEFLGAVTDSGEITVLGKEISIDELSRSWRGP